MKRIPHFVMPLLVVLITAQWASAFKTQPGSGGLSGKNENVAAGCAPPSSSVTLDLNNVRTIIHTGGDMYWDLITNARYEIPKNGGKHSIFAGSLWMGGVDVNNQLKVAAMRFRGNGYDFWPGPLDLVNAEISSGTCAAYDEFFTITRTEVDLFVAWFDCAQSPATCDANAEYPGYTVPRSITEWPAHGDVSVGQDYNLAPYFDKDGNGAYNPIDGGDYPFYERSSNPNCNVDREARLYGDETHWWVFNDKGNIHTESGGSAIGMEVRGQVFAFATNDEINDMTFNNYELYNRGSFTLTNTYFATFLDPDLGFYQDDYVGCDVRRGLGYCYNGNAVDGTGGPQHYGANPPAVGIDFFQGPFQDNDGVDNPLYNNCEVAQAQNENGIVYKGIGIGYGDGIADNERFGMRKFVYFNNVGQGNPATQDPESAPQYYNFMRGIWKDNNPMCYGADGHPSGGCNGTTASYMFAGDSDPCSWSTDGNQQAFEWTEQQAGNLPFDRRFVQSAGPFTLLPGAKNLITYGVVWARATQASDPFASVEKLRVVDDKAQALFDNCFILIDGPDAPNVEVVELDREIVLMYDNPTVSNNYQEGYAQVDPFIISLDTVTYDNVYRFQGYQVFQLKNETVSSSELGNPDVARVVAQYDIKDFHPVSGAPIGQLVNFTYSEELNGNIPTEMVNGSNAGIKHSVRITQDEFATGDRRLVNHKKYYFMVVAYAYNNFKDYDPNDPLRLDGQKKPYLAGRKNAYGGAIPSVLCIPHKNDPENGGSIVNAQYGDTPQLTRVEGQGNGGRDLKLTAESIQKILNSGKEQLITYENGRGPVDIKVVNPLKVPNAEFKFKILDTVTPGNLNDAYWSLECIGGNCPEGTDVVYAERPIGLSNGNEQIINDWGLSVFIEQTSDPELDVATGFISATISYSNQNYWFTGIPDVDGSSPFNWIRSGTVATDDQNPGGEDYGDSLQAYESVLEGTWAPYRLACHNIDTVDGSPAWEKFKSLVKLEDLASVDVIITSDQSKWTRCPVIELARAGLPTIGGAKRMNLRMSPSVGKDGKPDGTGTGMSWFPGYAINVETGERLNMAFGENSWLLNDNGGDMIWNPTSNVVDNNFDPATNFVGVQFGGMHYIYVFGHNGDNVADDVPAYDEGQFIYEKLSSGNFNPTDPDKRKVYKDAMWTCLPITVPGATLLSSDVKVELRVTKPYKSGLAAGWLAPAPENNDLPMYTFGTGDLAIATNDMPTAKDALDMIRAVPNPYYAFSSYEKNQLDNVVKIINLPQVCNVSIFDVSGTLVRKFAKGSPITSLDWDLKNHKNIPISSGVYLIHVEVPGVGEKVIKWFGTVRQLDLQSF
jgi:hypothetical protein